MFYSRFMPLHSTILAPLHNLLKKDTSWTWSKVEDAFVATKELILNSQTLVHYDHTLPVYLSCDASSYGAGAVLSHKMKGQFRPVASASCSLTSARKNYSHIEKEAFSIIFGLKRFQYLYGRSFVILTDHRPLLSLGPKVGTDPLLHTTTILSIAALQHMLMQTACRVFLYLRSGLQNVKMSSASSWSQKL